ncbi:MAG TPA: EAL domain-containing protein [Burkholderiales bacterium]|nr:EAL domain-containing protein [Burkholderiales bacterium]
MPKTEDAVRAATPFAGTRMFMISLSVIATALLVTMVVLTLQDYYTRRQEFFQDAHTQARVVRENVTAAVSFGDSTAATEILASLRASDDVVEAAVYRNAGLLAAYSRDGAATGFLPAMAAPGERIAGDVLEVVEPVLVNNAVAGAVLVRTDMRRLSQNLRRYGISALVLFCATLGSAALLLARMRRTMVRAEKDLEYLAHFDSLTRLPNRNGFTEILRHALARAERAGSRAALLFVDLDDFKLVNDTLGHTAGDELLAAVAKRVRARLRSGDTVSRLGGDEFTILLEQIGSADQAGSVARDIVAELSRAFTVRGQNVYIGASVGICLYPDDARSAADMIRNADTAMYRAKESGKKRSAFFIEGMTREQQARFAIENGLREALRSGGLRLVYQPQVELATRRLCGFEALMRWDHPEYGPLGPGHYLRIAESSDLIEELGAWVLREACAQGARWRAAGLPAVTVAVNIAVRQLQRKGLADEVRQALENAGLPAGYLEIEVTESGLMDNPERVAQTLQSLRASGVHVSIDDFGTGYSSLAYLKRLPVERLKIDKSFIRDIDRSSDDASIAQAVIALAGTLRLQTIAEGVETEAVAQRLRELGCWGAQGFHFSPPLRPEEAEQYLRASLHGARATALPDAPPASAAA